MASDASDLPRPARSAVARYAAAAGVLVVLVAAARWGLPAASPDPFAVASEQLAAAVRLAGTDAPSGDALAARLADRHRTLRTQAAPELARGLGELTPLVNRARAAASPASRAAAAQAYAERLATLLERDEWRGPPAGAFWNELAAWTIALGGLGLIGWLVVAPADVRARRAETRAGRERERLREVLDALPEAVYVADVSGAVVLQNRAAAQLGGAARDTDADAHVVVTGAPKTSTAEVRGGGWLTTTRTPLRGPDGNVVGVVAMSRDATEQRVAQAELASARRAARSAEEARTRFMNGVSHELRTPLNGVIGMTDLLLGTRLDEEQRELARTIQQSGKALAASIGNLLDLADIRAERVQPAEGAFEVRSVVESALAAATEGAAANGVHLRYLILSGVPRAAHGDELRILQVLTNLLVNAAKFSPEGAALVRVGSDTYSDGSLRLRFTVKDTGVGIAQNKLLPIFDAFTQADGSPTRAHTGAGLGLTIARQLVALMGGQIGVESGKGKGSTFWFTVPVGPAELTAEQQQRADARAESNLHGTRAGSAAEGGDAPRPDAPRAWQTDPNRFIEKGTLNPGRFVFSRSRA